MTGKNLTKSGAQKRPKIETRAVPFFDEEASAQLVALVRRELEKAGVTFYLGGATSAGVQRVSFLQEDAPAAMNVLMDLVSTHKDVRVFSRIGGMISGKLLVDNFGEGNGTFNIGRVVQRVDHFSRGSEPVRDLHVVYLEVAFWKLKERSKATFRFPTREHAQFGRMPEGSLPLDVSEFEVHGDDPFIGEPQFPIDVVYTWVDDQDADWQRQREAFSGARFSPDAQQANRFRNRQELLFSLRSLEMYAPFVRKVFLVTSGHVPDWLNLEHARLELVTHKQIFRDTSNLPTFNSSAIECCLHRITGLAEHHLYLNDDFFFGRPARASTYFAPNGTSYLFPGKERLAPDVGIDVLEEYIAADHNVSAMFSREFGFAPRTLMAHVPYAARVSRMHELEKAFPGLFEQCEANRFRHETDIRPYAFMYQHYANYRCWAVPGVNAHRYISTGAENLSQVLDILLAKRAYDTFVLNDDKLPSDDKQQEADQLLSRFLESYFPVKSRFEK